MRPSELGERQLLADSHLRMSPSIPANVDIGPFGYAASGDHSPSTAPNGLAADDVLEVRVVTTSCLIAVCRLIIAFRGAAMATKILASAW